MSKTLIASSKPPSDRQVGMFFDKLRLRIGKRIRDFGLTSQELQAVSSDGLREVEEGFLSLLQFVVQKLGTIVDLTVDYGRAASELIEEARFDWKYLGISPENIPVVGKGRKTVRVHQVHLNRVIYTRDLVNELPNMLDPIAALHYAIKHPDEQRKYSLAVVWKIGDEYFYLILDEDDGERGLDVDQVLPDGRWFESYRFLVACE